MFKDRCLLKPEELFKYRLPRDRTVPQKGGAKDYAPDGTWLQNKQIEAFHQERKAVLSEQRVEKLGSLVKGEWNPQVGLVEFKKEMGKFWSHMGFVDSSRKWLYPEEALYLMETLVFEVYYKDIPLSIQEAYSLFLKSSKELEEYQVYAHLRRLGYVVLRHRGKCVVTPYERKIKLDKYVKHLKQRKRKLEEKDKSSTGETKQAGIDSQKEEKKQKLFDDKDESEKNKMNTCEVNEEKHPEDNKMEINLSDEKQNILELEINDPNSYEKDLMDTEISGFRKNDKGIDHPNLQKITKGDDKKLLKEEPNLSSISSEKKHKCESRHETLAEHVEEKCMNQKQFQNVWNVTEWTNLKSVKKQRMKCSKWNFDEIDFPNIAGKDSVILKIPSRKLLPPNVEVSEEINDQCIFDVVKYRENFNFSYSNRNLQSDPCLESLHFSYADWMCSQNKIEANNWEEHKKKLREKTSVNTVDTPVSHLWEGEVTPLVRPEDAISTANILSRLSIIKPYKPGHLKQSRQIKISFDVFLPDGKFKKSAPGLPNHRVCVTRSSDSPPNLADLTAATENLNDGVPLHWAVVDNGEIAFYSFSNISLPVDISMG